MYNDLNISLDCWALIIGMCDRIGKNGPLMDDQWDDNWDIVLNCDYISDQLGSC